MIFLTRFNRRNEDGTYTPYDCGSEEMVGFQTELKNRFKDVVAIGDSVVVFFSDENPNVVSDVFRILMKDVDNGSRFSWLQPTPMKYGRNGENPSCVTEHEMDLFAKAGYEIQ